VTVKVMMSACFQFMQVRNRRNTQIG